MDLEENETDNDEEQTSGVKQLKFLLLDRTHEKREVVHLGFNCNAHNKNNQKVSTIEW